MRRIPRIDWAGLASLAAAILAKVRDNPTRFEAEARGSGITVEELTAAAIIEALREQIEGMRSFGTG